MKISELWGNRLIFLSAFLFALSLPTSIALDGVAAGVGILGFILLFVSSSLRPFPPLKPLLFFIIPELLRYAVSSPVEIFKRTDINHHLVPYFVSFRVAREREVFKKVATVLIVSTLVLCFSVIFEAFTHQNVKHFDWSSLSFYSEVLRARGLLDHPLTTGGVLYLLSVFFIAVYFYEKNRRFLIPLPFLFLSILFNESRSYWLASLTFLLLFSLMSFRSNKRLILTSAFILLTAGAVISQVPVLKDRFHSITDTKNNGSNITRLMIWKSHIKAFTEDYTLTERIFGAGDNASKLAWHHFGRAFQEVTGKEEIPPPEELKKWFHGGETHNLYLKFLTKYGILGLLGYLFFWIYVIYRNLERRDSLFIKAFVAGYVGFLVASFFENNFTDAEVQFTLFFILGVNFALISETAVRQR